MLTELCQELKNWFDRDRITGTFTITGGDITYDDGKQIGLLPGQYFRIVGSVFSDGVHQYITESNKPSETAAVLDLPPETFSGAVWALAIPKEVVSLAEEIAAWRAKYEATDSQAMSPFTSESFGGYSYSKGSGGNTGSGTGGSASSWIGAFRSRLNMWRKILP